MNLMDLKAQIENYTPYNEQEQQDKEEILRHLSQSDSILISLTTNQKILLND